MRDVQSVGTGLGKIGRLDEGCEEQAMLDGEADFWILGLGNREGGFLAGRKPRELIDGVPPVTSDRVEVLVDVPAVPKGQGGELLPVVQAHGRGLRRSGDLVYGAPRPRTTQRNRGL
jgi:hypothetical protein